MSEPVVEIVNAVFGVATLVSAISIYVWTLKGDDAGLPRRRWSTISLRVVATFFVGSLWLSWWDWWAESGFGQGIRFVGSWLTLVALVVWAVNEKKRRSGAQVETDGPTLLE